MTETGELLKNVVTTEIRDLVILIVLYVLMVFLVRFVRLWG